MFGASWTGDVAVASSPHRARTEEDGKVEWETTETHAGGETRDGLGRTPGARVFREGDVCIATFHFGLHERKVGFVRAVTYIVPETTGII